MTSFLVSPTEPLAIRVVGQVSSVPEMLGADVIWKGNAGMCGVQRKTVADLIASVRDGRLGKELEQMSRLSFKALIVEGSPMWTTEGELLDGDVRSHWSQKQHRGVLLSAQLKGVVVLGTRSHVETLDAIVQLAEWSERDEGRPSSLLNRGNGRPDGWGSLSDRGTAIHFLSGIEGVGPELAARIFDRFGRVPISWDCDSEELASVRGIGKKKLEKLLKVLERREVDNG